ncbi:hypothetical protein [Methyloprofundus sp.]|uniref:hypothetical protein n=1 Tax=Methyloprofundus sp. TaxID=2020875 RepID=UPI003D137685
MTQYTEQSFKETLYECHKHIEKITVAKLHLSKHMPLTVEKYTRLNDIDLSFVDQLIFRFSKLQDTLGEKLFPSVLTLSEEDVKRKTFLDILNRLEELDIIEKNEWLKLREIRNEIAHEYSFNTEGLVESITNIYNTSDNLIKFFHDVHEFYKENFTFLSSTKECT